MSSVDPLSIRLTETVQKGGCAAKLPAGQLRAVLGGLKLTRRKELAVGSETLDDAALWDLGDGRYLIQTLDFFTPIVDDPFDFGAIAAANSISDIYAMGGEPTTALTILGFPSAHLPIELLSPLMNGAIAKIHEAGASLAGGHTIDDDTLKLGFSVAGFVTKEKAWTNAGSRAGDHLILTKGLGTGTITSALKSKKAETGWIKAAISSMTQLNNAPELLTQWKIHAATDVTGFGIAGHALQMALASGVQFEIQTKNIPTIEGALTCLDMKILNKAHKSNADYVKDSVTYGDVSESLRWLTVDPQTSGGLLLSVPDLCSAAVIEALTARFPLTKEIGRVLERRSGDPVVRFS